MLDPAIAKSPAAGLTIADPKKSLERQLAVSHDLAIVIFHLPEKRAREIISATPGIDIAILANRRGVYQKIQKLNGCCLLKNNDRGRTLGYLDWDLEQQVPVKLGIIKLKPRIYRPDPEVRHLVSEFEKWRDHRSPARSQKKRKSPRPKETDRAATRKTPVR